KLGVVFLILILATFGYTVGANFSFGTNHASTTTSLPCQLGGKNCINIGYTEAWLNGETVALEYSHDFFCKTPPSAHAPSKCEVGAEDQVDPPSGAIVSPIRTVVPQGFTPPADTLQCPVAGRCIDHPSTIDLSRLFGASKENVTLPPHSNILEEDESFQSTWWPVIFVGVKNLTAWNAIV